MCVPKSVIMVVPGVIIKDLIWNSVGFGLIWDFRVTILIK